MTMHDDFERELLAAFAEEAADHVRGLTAGLLDLERGVDMADGERLIARVCRQAHSLKGAARAVGLAAIEQICQPMESVLTALKNGQLQGLAHHWDVLQAAVQVVEVLLAGDAQPPVPPAEMAKRLQTLLTEPAPPPATPPAPSVAQVSDVPVLDVPVPPQVPVSPQVAVAPPQMAAARQSQAVAAVTMRDGVEATTLVQPDATVRVHVRKIEALFAQSEELLGAAFTQRVRLADVRGIAGRVANWKKALEDEELTREAPPLGDQVGGMVKSLLGEVRQLERDLANDALTLDRQVRELVEAARSVLLLPFGTLLESFHKTVRDIAREQGKKIAVEIRGADIAGDRRILEGVRDPLLHLLRNACDHGIESVAERLAHGKPETAKITLSVQHVGAEMVELRVRDDGRGLNVERLRDKAIALGLYTADDLATWDTAALVGLAFAPELSTARAVTALSGRGLGLAIVRQGVEALGGTVHIETELGRGTTFALKLPVSLATFRGVVVQVAERVLVIPSRNVERALRFSMDDVGTIANQPTVTVDGAQLPFLSLAGLLGVPGADVRSPKGLLVRSSGRRAVLQVDAVLGEEEGLVKGLGKQLRRVHGVSGVATLAGHKLVPVLQVPDLLGLAVVSPPLRTESTPTGPRHGQRTGPGSGALIAVAEDSATARLLVTHVLQGAGHRVRAAANGAEALAMLRTESFDALVSDVEMPVMDGFALARAVRADPQLADLPIILVTSLESRQHREQGAAAGANAYVVKRNFEATALLAALDRVL